MNKQRPLVIEKVRGFWQKYNEHDENRNEHSTRNEKFVMKAKAIIESKE